MKRVMNSFKTNDSPHLRKISYFQLFVRGMLFVSLCGCSTLKKWWGGEAEKPVVKAQVETPDETIRFSENPNIGAFNERRYKKMNRKSLEEDSEVGSRAGSLWNTEGPSSYLFTQNKLHREGDLLNVKLEGNAKSQMESKIQVIKKLLARLEIISKPTAPPASPEGAPLAANVNEAGRAPAAETGNGKSSPSPAGTSSRGGTVSEASTSTEAEPEAPINIESIPTRVTERLGDGNYRVKGQQSFMIGKKEFRVIVTGLVRPEDFSDEGMSSNKLLDPQLDIVSLRRSL